MPTNNFLPFCETDTGTNLPTQGDYLVDPARDIGNQPGVASSKLNNKPLRQATFIASQVAQYVSDKLGADVLDDANAVKLLSQMNAAFLPLAPNLTKYTSGTGNWNIAYQFFIVSGSATAGATYTNNGVTYTVVTTVASGTTLRATGNGDPAGSGTLTKTGGTGDATLTFYASRKPIALEVLLSGGGGGSSGSGTSGTGGGGGTGGNTTFGTSLLAANGGSGGGSSGGSGTTAAGGTASLGTGPVGLALVGGVGSGACYTGSTGTYLLGGVGGNNPLGGGGGTTGQVNGGAGNTNTGGGGGGGGTNATNAIWGGAGGGAGGFVSALITSPLSTYAYAVGAGGAAGTAGTSGAVGFAGGSGVITVIERYQ